VLIQCSVTDSTALRHSVQQHKHSVDCVLVYTVLQQQAQQQLQYAYAELHTHTPHYCEQVTIREGQNGEVNVHGAIEEVVQSAEEMLMLLERGSMHRTTGSTLMNAASSRRYV
jgi:Kinesin motor domain